MILQEDEIVPTIYSGLSEDDRFIGKLLAAQNFMMNIQTEVTKLIQDYMKIRQKDRKRKQKTEAKQLKRKSGPSPVKPPAAKRPKKAANASATPAALPKPQQRPSQLSAPAYTQPQPQTPIVQQGMLKTRKNNLTLEDGNRLKQQIASLAGEQQMTVLAILKENDEHLEQDDEGNVEMEFREFSQKSIDDLKDYVNSVLSGGGSSSSAMASSSAKMSSNASSTKNHQSVNAKAKEDHSDSDDESDSSSSSDSDSDSDSD